LPLFNFVLVGWVGGGGGGGGVVDLSLS
jgi:hypothetical protein